MKGRVIALDTLRGRQAAALIVDGRLEDVVDAEDGLERSLAAKAEEIAEKLDLADQALE